MHIVPPAYRVCQRVSLHGRKEENEGSITDCHATFAPNHRLSFWKVDAKVLLDLVRNSYRFVRSCFGKPIMVFS
jgi:hypothetical protein